jgi:hypothetical protein
MAVRSRARRGEGEKGRKGDGEKGRRFQGDAGDTVSDEQQKLDSTEGT